MSADSTPASQGDSFAYESCDDNMTPPSAGSFEPPSSSAGSTAPFREVISLTSLLSGKLERAYNDHFDALSINGAFALDSVGLNYAGRLCKMRVTAGKFSFVLTLRASSVAPFSPLDVREEDVIPDAPTELYERAFACLLVFVLRFAFLESMPPPAGGLAGASGAFAVTRVRSQGDVMRGERTTVVEDTAAAAAATEALVARLRPVCAPRSAAHRVLLAIAYARDHYADHCSVCGKLHDSAVKATLESVRAAAGGGGGGGGGGGAPPPPAEGELRRGGAPRLCDGDFCRFCQLMLPSHVDLRTELELGRGGIRLLVVLALQALAHRGERRFAILHPVPQAFLKDAAPEELAAMGMRERKFAESCNPPQAIDYERLRAGLAHLALTADFHALSEMRSNSAVASHFLLRALARSGVGELGLRYASLNVNVEAPFSSRFDVAALRAMDEQPEGPPPPPVQTDTEYLLLWWVATVLPYRLVRLPRGVGELPAGVPENRHGLRADLLVFELMPRGIVARAARVADAELGTEIAPPAAARALWMGATRDQTPLKAAAHHFHGSNAGNFFSMLRNGIFIASRTEFMTMGNVLGDGAYFGRCYETSRGYSSAGSVEEPPLGEVWPYVAALAAAGVPVGSSAPPATPLAAKEAAAGDPHADEGAAAGPPQRAQRPAACCINHALRPIVVAIAALDPGSPEEQAGGRGVQDFGWALVAKQEKLVRLRYLCVEPGEW